MSRSITPRWPPSIVLTSEQVKAIAKARELSDLLDELYAGLGQKLPPPGTVAEAELARIEFARNALSIAALPPVLGKVALGRCRPYWFDRPLFTAQTLAYWRAIADDADKQLIDASIVTDKEIRGWVGPNSR